MKAIHDRKLTVCVTNLGTTFCLERIGVVWDAVSPDDLPVTIAERALIDVRLADMESNRDDQSPRPDAKARLGGDIVWEGWGNAGAASTQTIASGDGYLEVTATETNSYRLIGLSKR